MADAESAGGAELPHAWRRAFDRMKGKAGDYLHDPDKARRLVEQAQAKAAHRSAQGGPLAGVTHSLQTMGRLVRAYARREYTRIPWGIFLSAAAALLYFVTPLDAIPDVLLGFGLIDDAAILAFVATRLGDELARFEGWERERSAARVRAAAGEAEDAPLSSDEPVTPPLESPEGASVEPPVGPPGETPDRAQVS